jgi:hypothetical protein
MVSPSEAFQVSGNCPFIIECWPPQQDANTQSPLCTLTHTFFPLVGGLSLQWEGPQGTIPILLSKTDDWEMFQRSEAIMWFSRMFVAPFQEDELVQASPHSRLAHFLLLGDVHTVAWVTCTDSTLAQGRAQLPLPNWGRVTNWHNFARTHTSPGTLQESQWQSSNVSQIAEAGIS